MTSKTDELKNKQQQAGDEPGEEQEQCRGSWCESPLLVWPVEVIPALILIRNGADHLMDPGRGEAPARRR